MDTTISILSEIQSNTFSYHVNFPSSSLPYLSIFDNVAFPYDVWYLSLSWTPRTEQIRLHSRRLPVDICERWMNVSVTRDRLTYPKNVKPYQSFLLCNACLCTCHCSLQKRVLEARFHSVKKKRKSYIFFILSRPTFLAILFQFNFLLRKRNVPCSNMKCNIRFRSHLTKNRRLNWNV